MHLWPGSRVEGKWSIHHDVLSSKSLAINNFIDLFFPDKDQGNYILVGVSQSPDFM